MAYTGYRLVAIFTYIDHSIKGIMYMIAALFSMYTKIETTMANANVNRFNRVEIDSLVNPRVRMGYIMQNRRSPIIDHDATVGLLNGSNNRKCT